MIAVDTNVLVYLYDATEPVKRDRVLAWLEVISRGDEPCVLPWQVLVEFMAVTRRFVSLGKLDPAALAPIVLEVRDMFELLLPTVDVIQIALDLGRNYSVSHWDSMLLAACVAGGVGTLYSEDLADGASYAGVSVVNPFLHT